MEIWKDIEGYEGLYQISNFGKVKSLNYNHTKKEGLLSLSTYDGYKYAGLFKGSLKMCRVHRLLAIAFIPNPEDKPFVNHINGIRTDNRIDNLEWCTHSENEIHARKYLFKKSKKGEECKASKVVFQKRMDGTFIKKWKGIKEAGRQTGVNRLGIARCANGTQKHAGGYLWSYYNDS